MYLSSVKYCRHDSAQQCRRSVVRVTLYLCRKVNKIVLCEGIPEHFVRSHKSCDYAGRGRAKSPRHRNIARLYKPKSLQLFSAHRKKVFGRNVNEVSLVRRNVKPVRRCNVYLVALLHFNVVVVSERKTQCVKTGAKVSRRGRYLYFYHGENSFICKNVRISAVKIVFYIN